MRYLPGFAVAPCTVFVAWMSLSPSVYADQATPPPAETVVRLARSTDGLRFSDTGDILFTGAGSPDLTLLPNGDMIALFDVATASVPGAVTVPVVVRSTDGGRRWSEPRRIRIRGSGRAFSARHLDLVQDRGGWLRLFFVTGGGEAHRATGGAHVLTAVTRDGINYRVDGRVPTLVPGSAEVHPMAGWIRNRLMLWVDVASESGWLGTYQMESRGDGRLGSPTRANLPGVRTIGSLVPMRAGARAYLTTESGIRVVETTNGRTWKVRHDAQVPQGWDAGVVRVAPDDYLMAYCARSAEPLPSAIPPVPFDEENTFDDENPESDTEASDAVVDTTTVDDAADATVVSEDADAGDEPAEDDVDAEADATEARVDTDEPVALMSDFGIDGGTIDGYDPALTGGYAPLPTFDRKFSYASWFQRFLLAPVADNAADAYAAFMPQAGDEPGEKPEWPTFQDMYHDEGFSGPPRPWDPANHPAWEATSQAARDVFEQYRQASLHTDHVLAFKTAADPDADAHERELLLYITLPDLRAHRTLVKGMLADAWRAPEGKASGERMRQAIDTTLRVANHMHQGATLIEDLVGTTIEFLANKNARWALRHGVFSADEMKATLDTLRQRGVGLPDIRESLRGEHAFVMDYTQHLFTPPTVTGEPHFNRTRAERDFLSWLEEEQLADQIEATAKMTPADVRATVVAMDGFYRELGDMMSVGYPTVRASDIETLEGQYVNVSPVTRVLMPSLSRYYELRTRGIARRRATQVVFATELFKSEHGRYPASLEALSSGPDDATIIDPYTGEPFGYRVTDDGPRIYSLSVNGLDDGGIHSPRWGDDVGEGESDDFVFWPPQP